jgi:PEGA domain
VAVEPEEEESALSRGFMPLVLAIIVGLGIGFAAGYGVGSNAGAGQAEGFSAVANPPATTLTPDAPRPGAPVENVNDGRSTTSAPPTPVVVPPAAEPKAAPPAAAPPETGRIVVRSTPSNARVLLDGREVGRTPYTARDVGRGAHVVRVVRDGYQSAERRVTVSASEPSRTVSVVLARNAPERAPAAAAAVPRPPAAPPATSAVTGSLFIESRPARASVTVDGKPSGTTPMLLEGLEPGDHTIRLEAPDHQPLWQSVRIVAGQRSRLAVSLER